MSTFLKKIRKTLRTGKKSSGGRNNTGKITIHHRGGGHKRAYRKIEYNRLNSTDSAANFKVYSIDYDPNRNASLALIGPLESGDTEKNTSKFKYIIAPKGLSVGDNIQNLSPFPPGPKGQGKENSGSQNFMGFTFNVGDCLPLSIIPLGSLVHNIEKNYGVGGQLVRAAGSYGQIIEKNQKAARIRLPSGGECWVNLKCSATMGIVGNEEHQNKIIGKAGRSRWLGFRPTVRGVAMNPVDHPHGGGEGRTSGGRPSVSPWGKLTK